VGELVKRSESVAGQLPLKGTTHILARGTCVRGSWSGGLWNFWRVTNRNRLRRGQDKLRVPNRPRGTCYMPTSYSHSGNRATSVIMAILTTHPSKLGYGNTADSQPFQPVYHIIASSLVGSCLGGLDHLAHLIASCLFVYHDLETLKV